MERRFLVLSNNWGFEIGTISVEVPGRETLSRPRANSRTLTVLKSPCAHCYLLCFSHMCIYLRRAAKTRDESVSAEMSSAYNFSSQNQGFLFKRFVLEPFTDPPNRSRLACVPSLACISSRPERATKLIAKKKWQRLRC